MLFATVIKIARMLAAMCTKLDAIQQAQKVQGAQLTAILAQVSPKPATHIEIELGTPQPQ